MSIPEQSGDSFDFCVLFRVYFTGKGARAEIACGSPCFLHCDDVRRTKNCRFYIRTAASLDTCFAVQVQDIAEAVGEVSAHISVSQQRVVRAIVFVATIITFCRIPDRYLNIHNDIDLEIVKPLIPRAFDSHELATLISHADCIRLVQSLHNILRISANRTADSLRKILVDVVLKNIDHAMQLVDAVRIDIQIGGKMSVP